MGYSNCSPCDPCGTDQNAAKAAAYARMANTYATNAENSWLEFNALYLGAFASAPAVDNEGNPLQTGALYWNSVSNEMFVWNGTAWLPDAFNEFTPFLATGTPTARNLVTRTADFVNVKDFGAVGDGVADDTAAFQAAYNSAKYGNTILVPSGDYKILGTIPDQEKAIMWEIQGKSVGPTAPFFNDGNIPGRIQQNAIRFPPFQKTPNKVNYDSGSLLLQDSINGAGWPLSLSKVSSYTNDGGMALTGFTNDKNKIFGAAIGVSGFAIINKQNAWALYADVQYEATATGFGHGLELAMKNKGPNKNSTPYIKDGGVLGIWLAGGGDPAYGGPPANPSNTGISFIKNGHTWNKGIVFHDTSLTGCDGVTGIGSAIAMAKGHQIEWWAVGTTTPTAYIRCNMTNGAGVQRILIENGGFSFGTETFAYVDIPRINNAVNGFFLRPEIAGSPPMIYVEGSDTDIDIKIQGKGTGKLRFGTHNATADAPISGYIEIKDTTGATRKLAVIA